MCRGKKLRNVSGMDKVFIVPDLTLKQQDEDRKLREEIRKLKSSGVTNAKIFRGNIVFEDFKELISVT